MIKDICRTGVTQLAMESIINKYNIDFSKEEIKEEIIRLTNQLWKLIPMWENNEDWEKQLNTVIIDIAGKDEIFLHNSHFLQLLSKLEGIRVSEDIEFNIYRKTIFECINLINEVDKNGN